MELWYKKGPELLDELHRLTPGEGQVLFWYLGQMGCAFKTRDLLILIDPVLNDLTRPDGTSRRHYPPPFAPEALTGVNYILCTHDHADHLNPATCLPLLAANPGAKLAVPAPVARELGKWGPQAQAVLEGRVLPAHAEETFVLSPHAQACVIPSAHEEYHQDEHGDFREIGWLLHLGEVTLYHSGDTVVTDALVSRLQQEARIDLACLPINGAGYVRHRANIVGNMDCRDAAWLADAIDARFTVPMHYDMVVGNTEDPLIFAAYLRAQAPARRYKIMTPGEHLVLGDL